MENYFTSRRDYIFKNVQVLIFVFDVESREQEVCATSTHPLTPQRDFFYFKQCVEAMEQHSTDANIFCLVHKMDLIPEEQRDTTFSTIEAQLQSVAGNFKLTCCKTSIWDETLYKVCNYLFQNAHK